jgi:hypothetical protein
VYKLGGGGEGERVVSACRDIKGFVDGFFKRKLEMSSIWRIDIKSSNYDDVISTLVYLYYEADVN